MKEPKRAPNREIWVHESLVDEARRLWEQMVADLTRSRATYLTSAKARRGTDEF
jgi:hypothetical protein